MNAAHDDLKTTKQDSLLYLIQRVRNFIRERNWEEYHNPKDLAIALSIEASELLENFLWKPTLSGQEIRSGDPNYLSSIKDELADVVIYALSMANTLKLDLGSCILDKIGKNEQKYPPAKGKDPAPTKWELNSL